ncbi:MAG: hypothetical protein ACI841_003774 [Planctomycetota bacterium]|jgi:hypothetical protein
MITLGLFCLLASAGTSDHAGFGRGAVNLGDLNGDMVEDFAVLDSADIASIWVLCGASGKTIWKKSAQTGSSIGSLVHAGDWNDDGVDDLLVMGYRIQLEKWTYGARMLSGRDGAQLESWPGYRWPALVLNPADPAKRRVLLSQITRVVPTKSTWVHQFTGLSRTGARVLSFSRESDKSTGLSLATAGDLDGDRYDDILLSGSPSSRIEAVTGKKGELVKVYGRATRTPYAYAPHLSPIRDFDGDGILDFVALASKNIGSDKVYAHRYSSKSEAPVAKLKLTGAAGGVVNCGDVDGDGVDDVLVGAHESFPGSRIYVVSVKRWEVIDTFGAETFIGIPKFGANLLTLGSESSKQGRVIVGACDYWSSDDHGSVFALRLPSFEVDFHCRRTAEEPNSLVVTKTLQRTADI